MQSRTLVLSLIVLFLGLGSQGISLAQATFKGAQARFSLTISTAKPMVKAGSEVEIQIMQKNITDRIQPFWIENGSREHGELLFAVHVLGTDGKEVLRSEYFRALKDDTGNFQPGAALNGGIITKKPGEAILSSIDLNKLYELKPGKYTVQVDQKDSIGKVTVKSNSLTITVTP